MGNGPSCPAQTVCPAQTPILGFPYNPVNTNAGDTIKALQDVILNYNVILCVHVLPKLKEDINIMFKSEELRQEKKSDPAYILYEVSASVDKEMSSPSLLSVSSEQKQTFKKSIIKLVTIAVNNAVINKDGKIDLPTAQQNILDILDSFCPPKSSISEPVKSTFGSMSSFGESCGCTIWIILLILVLVAAGYMYYINRGNIKLPKLPKLPGRIAQFGRDIKSIRKN